MATHRWQRSLIEVMGVKLFAHKNVGARIDGVDVGLAAADVVKVGKSVELLGLDGH